MKDLVIYRSENNGLGGNISLDKTSQDMFYKGNYYEKFSCVYIKNESLISKRILRLIPYSIDYVEISTLTDEIDIKNKIANLHTDLNSRPDNTSFQNQLDLTDVVLKPNDYLCIWIKITQESNTPILKRFVNIEMEVLDEY